GAYPPLPPFPTRRSSDLPPPEGGAVDVEVGEQSDGPADRLGAPAVLGSVGRQRHRRQLLVEEVETGRGRLADGTRGDVARSPVRSEEHTSELQSRFDIVC